MASMTESKPRATLRGHVSDEAGRAVVGMRVTCNDREALTLFDGSFTFNNLPTGAYTVIAELEGYRTIIRQVEAEEAETVLLDLRLEPDRGIGRIYGRVVDEEEGIPLKEGGAMHMIHITHNRTVPIKPATGFYEFTDLPLGTYVIWASVLEYEDEKKTIKLERDEAKEEDFYVKKRKDLEPPWG